MDVKFKRMIKYVIYSIALISVSLTLVIGVEVADKPVSLSIMSIIFWAASPYSMLFVIAACSKSKMANTFSILVSVTCSVLSLGLIIDSMYFHLDPQGGLVFVFLPVWQWVGLIVSFFLVIIINRVGGA